MPVIRNISDTARWAADFRAVETERKDALFRDPFARRLAGTRGAEIATADQLRFHRRNAWSWVMRTYIMDEYIEAELARGTDLVLNLAAGLDARPYRMHLPPGLKWVEVDLPEILDYKEEVLAEEQPRCALERVRLDLSELRARRALFDRVGREARRVMVISEGLLVYLSPEQVASLAEDLAAQRTFQRWGCDVISPGLLRMLQKEGGEELTRAGAPFKFAPPEGQEFFRSHGWVPLEVRSPFKTAAKLRRLPLLLRFFALFPEPKPAGNRPWSGICLLGRA